MADAGEGHMANLHLDDVTGERIRYATLYNSKSC